MTSSSGSRAPFSAALAFVVAAAGAAAAFWLARENADWPRSFLVAWVYWLFISMGSVSLLLLHALTGGAWGLGVRPALIAATALTPILALAFPALVFNLEAIYPWAGSQAEADPLIATKAAYLNRDAFALRAVVYFVLWIALCLLAWRTHARPAPEDSPAAQRRRRLCGQGLALYGLSMTFAAVDWGMSLEPHWFSAIYGVLWVVGQGVAALAFGILVTAASAGRGENAAALWGDLGKLLLGFIMIWTYMAFSQFLIIWYGNLPEEVTWYLYRGEGLWLWMGISLAAFHFALPFFILLGRDAKRRPALLASVAALVLVMRWVDTVWMIQPPFHPADSYRPWLDLAMTAALGGVWAGLWALLAGRAAARGGGP